MKCQQLRIRRTRQIFKRAALIAQSEKSTNIEELRSIEQRLKEVNDDINYYRQTSGDERTQAVNSVENRAESPKFMQGEGFKTIESRGNYDYSKIFETRGKFAAQCLWRIASTYAPEINNDFNAVSSLIDSVAHLSLNGGESFRQPYITGIDTGGYTAEGVDAAGAETHFAYVDINKSKVTAYAELTEELNKLPNAAYADVVFQNIRNSMRMLLTKEILVGAGNTNQMVGIFSDKATAIDSATDLSLATIDDGTLDEIVYSYGGIL